MARNFGKSGRHYRYEPTDKKGKGAIEFWAENGMICLLDERLPASHDEHFLVLTIREFLVNLRGINYSIERCAYSTGKASMARGASSPGGAAAEERQALNKLVEEGISCAKEARSHGDPANPRHLADIIKQRRRSMVQMGANPAKTGDGAVSASVAPEAAKLPPLVYPGAPKLGPTRPLIIP